MERRDFEDTRDGGVSGRVVGSLCTKAGEYLDARDTGGLWKGGLNCNFLCCVRTTHLTYLPTVLPMYLYFCDVPDMMDHCITPFLAGWQDKQRTLREFEDRTTLFKLVSAFQSHTMSSIVPTHHFRKAVVVSSHLNYVSWHEELRGMRTYAYLIQSLPGEARLPRCCVHTKHAP